MHRWRSIKFVDGPILRVRREGDDRARASWLSGELLVRDMQSPGIFRSIFQRVAPLRKNAAVRDFT